MLSTDSKDCRWIAALENLLYDRSAEGARKDSLFKTLRQKDGEFV